LFAHLLDGACHSIGDAMPRCRMVTEIGRFAAVRRIDEASDRRVHVG
jgi:hypothetical protein